MKYEFRTQPYAHQREALVRSWDRDAFALFMEMGTGKTKVVVDNIGICHHQGMISGVLVLSNKGSYRNWVDTEIPAHMPEGLLQEAHLHTWRGLGSGRERDAVRAVCRSDSPLAVLTMNVEGMSSSGTAYRVAETFLRSRKCMMVVDESTQIKNPSAERTKKIIKLGRLARMRRIMTGMPASRSPLDVYSQFEFLGRGMLGYTSYWAFRSKYAVLEDQFIRVNGELRKYRAVTGYRNIEGLHRAMQPHSYRILKEQCLDLPPKVYERRTVELTPEQRRVYDGIVADATAQLGATAHVTATAVITQLIRMHEVCCGFSTDEEGHKHDLPENRTQATMDALEEAGGRGVVWCAYRHPIGKLVTALSRMGRVVEYHGGVPQEQRTRNMREFQDGSADFFVGTQQTGGYGNTLTSAWATVYHSNTYSLELRAQSEERTHRIGQSRTCTYADLVAPGTIDERFLEVIRGKIDLSSQVMGDGYRAWVV